MKELIEMDILDLPFDGCIWLEMNPSLVEKYLHTLSKLTQKVIIYRYGLKNHRRLTIEETSKKLNLPIKSCRLREHAGVIHLSHEWFRHYEKIHLPLMENIEY